MTSLTQNFRHAAGSVRVLIMAPTGRDADFTAAALKRSGFECLICPDGEHLCKSIEEGAGIVVMTAEGLTPQVMSRLAATLAAQPRWSEIPLMVFVAQPEMERAARSFEPLGPRAHVILVDRPIHVKTLVSAARAALRSRTRQYEVRDLLAELEGRLSDREMLLNSERAHARRLAGLAEASLAIASALSLDEVLQMITDQACLVIDAEVAVTSIEVEERGRKRSIRSVSSMTGLERWKAALGEEAGRALDQLALELEGPLRMARDEPPNAALDQIFGSSRGSLAAPLTEREGASVGVIALSGKSSGEFTIEDESVLTQLAQMASAAVQNARLYREAQEANKVKDDFLATLAHELRTPMTGILGWVQMLKVDNSSEEDVRTAIQMIESSTRVQARLVEDLLDVSRIIAGKLRIALQAVELGPVVEGVIETFRARAEESGVKLDATIDPMPLSVFGDETRLHQVIWNLLSNAIKFTPAGGFVHVDLLRSDSKAIIRVTDSGQGINPEFLPLVFERFRQADNTTTRPESGLGLGLAIVRHLVEMHSGTVRVDSEGPGKGASFTVTLPVLAVRIAGEELDVRDLPDLSGVRILVVDDDADAGELVATVLGRVGAEVQAVTSVDEALRTLRSFAADVVVSDIAMPGEDGYALMRRLQEIQPVLGREVRTVALTGYGRPEDRHRILASGFERYIQKPVEPLDLARAVAGLMNTQ